MNVAWHGADNPNMGYGSSNLALIDALQKAGVNVLRVNKDAGVEDCEIGVAYSIANQGALEMLPSQYRIMFTMFETDEWPASWVSTCNCANQVWVPSQFCKDTLLKSGCDSPVNVVPLGIDPDVYYPEDREANDVFTFGYSGSATLRKGYDLLLRAFQEEFRADEPVKLRIHSSNILSSIEVEDSRIEYTCKVLTPDEQRLWYSGNDCFVMPTRGEGFSLTPLESLACGCAVAITNWGGQVDYLADDCLRIAIDGLEHCNGYHSSKGKWAKPSLASTRYCMRYAFERPDEMTEMGAKASARVRKDWTYKQSSGIICGILALVDTSERVDIEAVDVVVWWGDPRNVRTPCGGFTRGEPRELDAKIAETIDPNDSRFHRERRYRRKLPGFPVNSEQAKSL